MLHLSEKPHFIYTCLMLLAWVSQYVSLSTGFELNHSLTYIWPLPHELTSGNETLTVNPTLSLSLIGKGGNFKILREGFRRYKRIIFKQSSGVSIFKNLRRIRSIYDISQMRIIVNSDSDELKLGVDESYTLFITKTKGKSIAWEAIIEVNTIYGALRGLENVLHWHIIDEQSFPLEIPKYPKLWNGAYTKWERYTVEDASKIVRFAKTRGIHVMAEVDVPGHAESWGIGYPDLWPSTSCREPLDVTKNFTFDLISGIFSDIRKIFPFELFHLGGDEVNIGCWNNTPHVKQWLKDNNMKPKDAYKYFVLKAQEIAISKNWTPVNWEETFHAFAGSLNPQTVVHNWLGPGVCPKAVAKGFKCIFSNSGVWYLDHLDVTWEQIYNAEPLEGIDNESKQKLVLGGEVCMWGETVDTSNVQQTIWPRAAAAAERLWSTKTALSAGTDTVLHRLHYFRCLLQRRGVQAAPVTNYYARQPPVGPDSCYWQ
ncbi:hypothetical protein J1N35_036527 [Gossypium stocksii]|uniref:Beta-hexosaminidase n=1 Tax=Gossypium stocksii TaxID=47602 RepID=A0A9D3UIJ8_9ROSI|nr:hypothetical protein J1N35_036527 [Gossypium stocksii]